MTRLTWDDMGERYYESGVDKGVLYIDYLGVAWSGLISVVQSPTGGEPKPYYLDGFKYLNLSSAEEYEATINAFQAPAEFLQCEGIASIQNGLFAGEQPRKEFGLSYRTRIGNDVSEEIGYKIHIVYGCLASPSERSHGTINDSVDPLTLSWKITSRPDSNFTGLKPTAHFVIDTRLVEEPLLTDFQEIIYGSDVEVAYIPFAVDLIEMFSA